jgi:SSS family solute:Na+ symporter
MGVFLRTGGEFLLTVVGLGATPAGDPAAVPASWGQAHVLELTMTALLLLVAIYTVLGGMLSVLVTDFLQFIVMSAGLLVVTILILFRMGWEPLRDTVSQKLGPAGFNPFVNPELGVSYVLFNACMTLATVLTWQTTIQRVMAAKDAKTGQKIYTRTAFFFVCRFLVPGLWGIAALHALAPGVGSSSLNAMPTWLSTFLPVGLMGLLVAAMLAADMSTDSSYMLTWASVIYNDIIAPWRRPGWTESRGLLMNRLLVAAIGVFLLFYGLWYELPGVLWDYLALTATIYLASMSTLLVACCYWPHANKVGATAAIVVGAVFPVAYLVAEQTWPEVRTSIGPYWSGLASYAGAGAAMVIGSLLTRTSKEARA